MTLDEAARNIGRGVVYRSGTDRAEDGTITGVSGLVFVLYAGDTTPKATYPQDLEFLR
jgi:hypothetical protein